ncbi:MAG: Do family serine endopeptidase, partial [Catalinimonas sp.]
VVHIRSSRSAASAPTPQPMPDVFRRFFGDEFDQGAPRQRSPQQASGSGVIIDAAEGFIVTNNHVVANADQLEVTLSDQRTYAAKLIGTDPTTDLAVIQIEGDALAALNFASSDDVRVGEWVLAVGNPFNLESTVTAGIVSAKGRGIGILARDNYDQATRTNNAVESFIQTDAAVNPGNSGGALVNLRGELIGINTAISSPTGSYTGYSFAVPSLLVRKIAGDLIEYGAVQRGLLGVTIQNVNGRFADEKGLAVTQGVYVNGFSASSGAADAGLEAGDVIVAVDGQVVNASSELQERISRRRPGDRVQITVNRDGRERDYAVELRSMTDAPAVARTEAGSTFEALGVDVRDLEDEERAELGEGVMVRALRDGELRRQTSVRPGFVIQKVNDEPVGSAREFQELIDGRTGGVMLEGRYPNSARTYYYAFGL